VRDGGTSAVRATELVVGDLLTLEEGQRVPADVYVVHAEQLRVPGLEAASGVRPRGFNRSGGLT
jgi:magnesium-transporting ATPase (P-type)